MSADAPVWDAIVVGAGIAGAAAALGLKRAMGGGGRVLLCDPALAHPVAPGARPGFRALAIAPDVQVFLARLGVWEAVAADAQPVCAMDITDARPGLLPNQRLLRFAEDDLAQGPLAHMSLADPLRQGLLAACSEAGVVLDGSAALDLTPGPWGVTLVARGGVTHRGRLLAAADGGRSRLRHAARIQAFETDYPQSAIIATLKHPIGHRGRAAQHFFPGGPIALLPLKDGQGGDHRTSLVWTEVRAVADRLAALSADDFCTALRDRVGQGLGAFTLEDRPQAHPLRLVQARTLVGPRLALLGDAARVIHPLAGQGLNLGLRDAQALTRHVGSAAELGLDPGSAKVLDAYQAERRPASTLMAAGTDLLDRLFSSDAAGLRALRDVGLGVVDRLAPLKRDLIQAAAGYDRVRGPSS